MVRAPPTSGRVRRTGGCRREIGSDTRTLHGCGKSKVSGSTTVEAIEREGGAPRVRIVRILSWARDRCEHCEVCGADATLSVRRYERAEEPNTATDYESRYFCDRHEAQLERCYLDWAAKGPTDAWETREEVVPIHDFVKRAGLDAYLRDYLERQ